MSSEINSVSLRPNARRAASSIGRMHLLAPIVIGLCVAGPAIAATVDPAAENIEGRWIAESDGVMLDLSRCKEGWCGVEVNGTSCGRTALRIAATEPAQRTSNLIQFLGKFERTSETQPYAVNVQIVQNAPTMRLKLVGHTGDQFAPWRRTFPLNMLLTRSGEPQCMPDSKVS